jgi:hypothetical protein
MPLAPHLLIGRLVLPHPVAYAFAAIMRFCISSFLVFAFISNFSTADYGGAFTITTSIVLRSGGSSSSLSEDAILLKRFRITFLFFRIFIFIYFWKEFALHYSCLRGPSCTYRYVQPVFAVCCLRSSCLRGPLPNLAALGPALSYCALRVTPYYRYQQFLLVPLY